MRYETAGSLKGGRQIWLLGKMPEAKVVGDDVEPYICFTNTHDGSGAVRVCMTPVRVVCNNTLNLALNGAKRIWSTRHSGDIKLRIADAQQTLELASRYMIKLEEESDKLANARMTHEELLKAIEDLFPVEKDATPRQKETAERQQDEMYVCMLRPDIRKFLGTKWGFLNGVADFVDHSPPLKETKNWKENRWGNIIGGHALLDKAMAMVA